jgi:outer membrane protein TolC
VARLSRIALSVGVVTQVNLAYVHFGDAKSQWLLLKEMNTNQQKLLSAAEKAFQYGELNGIELISIKMDALVSQIDYLKAYGDYRVAIELVDNAIGQPLYFQDLTCEVEHDEECT